MITRIPMDNYIDQERRQQQLPVDYDRRRDIHARVSVLEVQLANNSQRIDDHSSSNAMIINRLDTHIQQSTARDQQLQQTIGEITTAVTVLSGTVSETNTTLKEIARMATESHGEILKWNTIIATLFKVGSVAGIIIGAIWTVFTYASAHM